MTKKAIATFACFLPLALASTAYAQTTPPAAPSAPAASPAQATAPAAQGNDASPDSGQPVTDTWITTKIKAELATTKGVDSMDVSVKTVDGKVTLTGVLKTDEAVKKAEAVAKSVKGVKDVDASGLKTKG
jgi:hyperosmotically inducible protein